MADASAKRQCPNVPNLRLNTGAPIPVVGLGTWKSAKGEVATAVEVAIKCGYRHIDAAAIYGNEEEVGEGMTKSGVARDQLFVTSKLWNAFHAAADVETACRDSLSKLGTDYLDLYLMHWPICLRKGHPMPPTAEDYIDVPFEETWKAMEALVEKGLCKAIGVSNFSAKKIEEILSYAKIVPAMNQIEAHPYLQQPKLKEFCDKHGILLTGYGPLGSGDRPARVKDESDPVLLEDTTLADIAKGADRLPADVLLRWAVQRGTIVIPKSVTAKRIESNLSAALNPLPEEAMQKLQKMDRHLRLFKGTMWTPKDTKGPIKDANADLWDEAPALKLNTGALIPAVGLGTWKSAPGQVQEAVKVAINVGYRHIDCAAVYGNEAEVGEGIKQSGIARDQLFITSKLWNAFHAKADVETACRDSLSKLGTDYLDLYLIHWPICLRKGHAMPPAAEDYIDVPLEETWKAMEALVDKGLCKAIGVSNFSEKKIEQVLGFARIKPAMNQVEAHPYLQQPKLKQFCDHHNILFTAYGPLGSGDRPARVKDESDPVLLEDKVLADIAKDSNRLPADVLLRWAVQRGTIVIPKSVTAARIENNLAMALTPLPEAAMDELQKMDQHLRLFKGTMWTPEGTAGPIKNAKADLWDEQ